MLESDWYSAPMRVVEDLIYDVGFHRGEDTAYYLRKGYRVVAFEANPDLVEGGAERFQREVAEGRLEIVEGAIADSTQETISFYRHPGVSVFGTTNTDWVQRNRANVTQIEVPVVRFADHLRRTGIPYFVKIDIEGDDSLCLDALLALEARPALLSLESDKTDFDQLRHELDTLERLGFDRFAAVPQAQIGERAIETRTRDGETFEYRFEPGSSGGFGTDIERWSNRAEVERQYRAIFRRYKLFESHSLKRRVRRIPVIKRALPGWYDTHAARQGVEL